MNEEKKENVEEKKKTKVQETAKKGEGGKYAGAIAAALFSGVVIGLVTGVLFAPKKGKQTRKEIVDKSRELVDKSKKTIADTLDKTKEFTKESKCKFDEVIGIVTPKKEKKKAKENK